MSHRGNFECKALATLYIEEQKSVHAIAEEIGCSDHKVRYWLNQYGIPKRTISEAIYLKNNPSGDPFFFRLPRDAAEERLFGLGVGFYWGEGNKMDKHSIRIGNSDPALISIFMEFLFRFFSINKNDLRFHLHLFTDIDAREAQDFWSRALSVSKDQFYKPFVIQSKAAGTYKKKVRYGVATLYYSNTKARNILIDQLQTLGAYGSMKQLPL